LRSIFNYLITHFIAEGNMDCYRSGFTGNSINADGLLTVAASETATTLIVTATSVANSAKSDAATVTVISTGVISSSEMSSNPLKAWMRDGTLHIEGLTKGKVWSIYSLSGTLIYRSIATSAKADVQLSTPAGVYIIQSEDKRIKLVIN
jgi:hypothetical protein